MVGLCLLERWLANPAVLLSAAASEPLLRSSSSSLKFVSRNSLYLRTAMSFLIVLVVSKTICSKTLRRKVFEFGGDGVNSKRAEFRTLPTLRKGLILRMKYWRRQLDLEVNDQGQKTNSLF